MGGGIFLERPLIPKVHAVFIHVSHLRRSAIWYSQLLGVPINKTEVQSPVYNLSIEGETFITLDDHKYDPFYEPQPYKNPAFSIYSEDLKKTYSWIRSEGYEIVSDIEVEGDFGWFNIADPDRNVIMICGKLL